MLRERDSDSRKNSLRNSQQTCLVVISFFFAACVTFVPVKTRLNFLCLQCFVPFSSRSIDGYLCGTINRIIIQWSITLFEEPWQGDCARSVGKCFVLYICQRKGWSIEFIEHGLATVLQIFRRCSFATTEIAVWFSGRRKRPLSRSNSNSLGRDGFIGGASEWATPASNGCINAKRRCLIGHGCLSAGFSVFRGWTV